MTQAHVSRSQVNQGGKPGPAWVWHYTVHVPGEPYTFHGRTLSWVRDLCRRYNVEPIYDWKETPNE